MASDEPGSMRVAVTFCAFDGLSGPTVGKRAILRFEDPVGDNARIRRLRMLRRKASRPEKRIA